MKKAAIQHTTAIYASFLQATFYFILMKLFFSKAFVPPGARGKANIDLK